MISVINYGYSRVGGFNRVVLTLGIILILVCSACAPNTADVFSHPKNFEDAVLIYQAKKDEVALRIYGGELEPFADKEWYLVTEARSSISIVMELDNLEEDLWLESAIISTINNPTVNIEVLNPPTGKWENGSNGKPSFVVFQAMIDVPALTTAETTFSISVDLVYGKQVEGLSLSKNVFNKVSLSETVTIPVRMK